MFDNYIEALELLEDLGAHMMSFGAVGQTPVGTAYYNGYDIPDGLFVIYSPLLQGLFKMKWNMKRSVISKFWDTILKRRDILALTVP